MIIRRATPNDIPGLGQVHVDTWRTTYPGLIPDSVLEGLNYTESEERIRTVFTNNTSLCLVSVDETGRICGFVTFGPERSGSTVHRGEIYGLYLFKENQGQGIGRQLMRAAALELRKTGLTSMLVWVLKGNPAEGFYAKLGGVFVGHQEIEIGGVPLDKVSYSWEDTSGLVGDVENK